MVCIGGGPSLTEAHLALIEDAQRRGRCRVVVVNDGYLVFPTADLCYFADARWWQWHTEGIAKAWPWVSFTAAEVKQRFAEFRGQKVTIENSGMLVADPEVFMLHNDTARSGAGGLSEAPNAIRTGSNGGYQVINIATLAGAKRIGLVGYDMRYTGGRSHAHNGHPVKTPEGPYLQYARNFDSMLPQLKKMGIEVVNCTPGSALRCFPMGDLEGFLAAAA